MHMDVVRTSILADLLGESPAALHPVRWMGNVISAASRSRGLRLVSNRNGDARRTDFRDGVILIAVGATLFGALGLTLQALSRSRRGHAAVLLEGLFLKQTHSLGALVRAARDVRRPLAAGNVPLARELLAFHLVSRPTDDLSEAEICGAVVESLSENLSDAFVAPLFAYAVGGLSLAYVYRFINTADAMIGYRTSDLEWFGKAAARCDDCLNFVPARITAFCLMRAATRRSLQRRKLIRAIARDAARTPSPNAGWPMSAAANILGLRLRKRVGTTILYDLNPSGRIPTVQDISRAIRLSQRAARIALNLISPSEGGLRRVG